MVMCLSCGCDTHIRADGACMQHGCAKKIDKWEAEAPTKKVIPLEDLKAPDLKASDK